ncbi:Sodium Bile acid symporter family protein [Gimesia maris]|uniref:bile acid:sodium symporter family protein n=1 Tax=Gimesia maris TaxID=122 RepID=UPI0011879D1F|nr:bile acid:sodium symporter family protein [Gimesia maris]QDU13808.1 Sodium Bile acid symporter family protein [Gimesia maris]
MKQQLFRLIQIPFTLWVLLFAVSGYYFPWLYDWNHGGWEPRQAIVPLVQVIMFGMGVSLSFADFRRVLKMPRAVLIGVICQFSIMPFLAWIFVVLFQLPTEIAAGLILIGSCPGGVTSNVIAYIARANVPLSVTMTACSTLLSPFLTPLLMEFWAGQYVPIPVLPMMRSILFMVLLPVLLGLFVNQFAPRFVNRLGKILPGIAMFSICLIIAITIALARQELAAVGLALFAAALCQNAAGYTLGYGAAWCLKLSHRDCRTVAFEVGIQNGGMATGLAVNVLKNPVIALGSAVFGPWSAITSSLLASYWKRCHQSELDPDLQQNGLETPVFNNPSEDCSAP